MQVTGIVSGAISGLVAITPACGFVDPTGAFFIGLFAGNDSDDKYHDDDENDDDDGAYGDDDDDDDGAYGDDDKA